MGDVRGFLTLRRAMPMRQPLEQRVRHWREFYVPIADDALRAQGARCMDCGVPFCQSDSGCPVRNVIPEWNDLVHTDHWREASDVLHSTNNFPELTGRLCPAPCESACVLSLIDQPVTIRNIEQAIADRAFREGWIAPRPPRRKPGSEWRSWGRGRRGSRPRSSSAGPDTRSPCSSDRTALGGLLRYGIPEFKLEKSILDRRLAQLDAEGVVFRTGVSVGEDLTVDELRERVRRRLPRRGARGTRAIWWCPAARCAAFISRWSS